MTLSLIHFVWAGGPAMPPNTANTFFGWHIANPNWAICLWADRATAPALKASFKDFPAIRVSSIPMDGIGAGIAAGADFGPAHDMMGAMNLFLGAGADPKPPEGFLGYKAPERLSDL